MNGLATHALAAGTYAHAASYQVMAFWGKAQRVVEWKIRRDMEKERNEMLSDRLDKLVGQTEKFSRQLAVEIGVPTVLLML